MENKKDIDINSLQSTETSMMCALLYLGYFHNPDSFSIHFPEKYFLLDTLLKHKKLYLVDKLDIHEKLCDLELFLLKCRNGFEAIKNNEMLFQIRESLRILRPMRKRPEKYYKKIANSLN